MTSLHILLLEDSSNDAQLVKDLLEENRFVCELVVVQTREAFVAALGAPVIDLILADYSLPAFDGLSALELAQERRPEIPFIFVSGVLGEELAVEALRIGATDYVLKTRLSRLVPSVQRALGEARERAERKRAEDALRRSEMYLAEAQRLSHTGSFGWHLASGELYWSDETHHMFEVAPGTRPTLELVIGRTHPDDRACLQQILDRAARDRHEFTAEHRIVTPDGVVKHVRAVARGVDSGDGFLFVGAVTDITERKRAEQERERLRQLEADLAHLNRVSMMGELAASLAHEVKQPMAAAAMNASACMQWLRRETPDIAQADNAASAAVSALKRAIDIINGVNSLYRRSAQVRESVDLNEIVREMTFLLSDTANRSSIAIRNALGPDLPKTTADPVQLKQVLLNLMLNGIEAMRETGGELVIASSMARHGQMAITVTDSGTGLPPDGPERVFDAFFTTKENGTGMGLCICRRIIETHGGRLVAVPNPGPGATFQFTLPVDATVSLV